MFCWSGTKQRWTTRFRGRTELSGHQLGKLRASGACSEPDLRRRDAHAWWTGKGFSAVPRGSRTIWHASGTSHSPSHLAKSRLTEPSSSPLLSSRWRRTPSSGPSWASMRKAAASQGLQPDSIGLNDDLFAQVAGFDVYAFLPREVAGDSTDRHTHVRGIDGAARGSTAIPKCRSQALRHRKPRPPRRPVQLRRQPTAVCCRLSFRLIRHSSQAFRQDQDLVAWPCVWLGAVPEVVQKVVRLIILWSDRPPSMTRHE